MSSVRGKVVSEDVNVGPLELTNLDFHRLSGLIRAHSGISITPDKAIILASRLRPLLRAEGYSSFKGFVEEVLRNPSEDLMGHIIDRVATNYTYFFREREHFHYLQHTALPEITARLSRSRSTDLRIWSAACSTGAEAYSLRMVLGEFFGESYEDWRAGVLATDISSTALSIASAGVYPSQALSKVPHNLKNRYFEEIEGPEKRYRFRDDFRSDVVLRRLNLHCAEVPFRQRMHVVFCRNVLMYFDIAGKAFLESRIYDLLERDGLLVIGLTESLQTEDELFEHVEHGVFRKRRSPKRS
jgi:chemotaxis protein methyltransferase CheR